MSPERWARITELFEGALECDAAARVCFLSGACGVDEDLFAELQQLLIQHNAASGFLKHSLMPAKVPAFSFPADGAVFLAEQVVGDRFRIVKTLGLGGMGEVYEAFDQELLGPVALKTIRHDIASDPRVVERFKREVQHSRSISHPNVCRVHDLFRERRGDDDLWFLTMELLRGQTLSDRVRHGGPLTAAAALPLVRQMCEALDAAHRSGIVHSDFKSGNVMLIAGAASNDRIVVTDFGLAQPIPATAATMSSLDGVGRALGTPNYMSPEQLEGQAASPASDLYALGVVMYEMLTGARPFGMGSPSEALQRITQSPTPPRAHVPNLDPRWEDTILRCLERDPARRLPSAAAVCRALDRGPSPVFAIPSGLPGGRDLAPRPENNRSLSLAPGPREAPRGFAAASAQRWEAA
jgi:serine/threonine protein kinase